MFTFSFSIFILSGTGIVALLAAKKFKTNFFLKIISRWDDHARAVRHEILHFYAEGKHKLSFILRKQAPLKIKWYLNRCLSFVKERSEKYLDSRNSRELKRPENISEFFKNIAEIEKGNGKIYDSELMINDVGIEVQKPKRKYVRRKVKVVEVE